MAGELTTELSPPGDPDTLVGSEEAVPVAADTARGPGSTAWSWLLLAVPLVIVLVGAWNYRWVQEDAFINFRIIGNLLAGHGPVFNVGERVEVYSDPLWMFSLAGLHAALPFVSIEWLSVLLGLVGTATGVTLAGRAIQRVGASRDDGVVMPLGLVIFGVVAGVWEFATSGLEMGMVFGWLGLSFWLLVRAEERRHSPVSCAFVVGLGTLIRPELVLMSIVFLIGLAFIVASPGWRGPTSVRRRWILPAVAAAALPVLYELFRMAYFAMVVSNSALAKSAGGSNLDQGMYYLRNFISTYALWAPFLLVLPLMVPRVWRWWAGGDLTGVVVVMTPVLAGLVDAVYVLHLGGDYMEARLLLPAFMSMCMVIYVDRSQLRMSALIFVTGIAVWAVVCGGFLRYHLSNGWVHNMHDERSNWIATTAVAHPIDPSSYRTVLTLGSAFNAAARSQPPGHQEMVVIDDPGLAFVIPTIAPLRADHLAHAYVLSNSKPARSALPFRVVIDIDEIGSVAYVSGPQVYIFDSLSLANPIGSHTWLASRGIPGHEKSIGPVWMIARFGQPGEQFTGLNGQLSASSIAAARQAMGCAPLSDYLHAITAPLGLSQLASNVSHAFTFTRMSFSADPNIAVRELCH
jgi:arabinofuranosyltransferase